MGCIISPYGMPTVCSALPTLLRFLPSLSSAVCDLPLLLGDSGVSWRDGSSHSRGWNLDLFLHLKNIC